jgi:hypothetical protein
VANLFSDSGTITLTAFISPFKEDRILAREIIGDGFIEVFVKYFRPWIKKFHGDEVGEYPMSHLVAKYLNDFKRD